MDHPTQELAEGETTAAPSIVELDSEKIDLEVFPAKIDEQFPDGGRGWIVALGVGVLSEDARL